MCNLRLVFENVNGDICDQTLPVHDWIVDWHYSCNYVPSNDTELLIIELDGKRINKTYGDRTFIEFAKEMDWDKLKGLFLNTLDETATVTPELFREWLDNGRPMRKNSYYICYDTPEEHSYVVKETENDMRSFVQFLMAIEDIPETNIHVFPISSQLDL